MENGRSGLRLELADFPVTELAFSDETRYAGGALHVSKEDIRRIVLSDDHFVDVEANVARPGAKTRIINIMDVIEPRHKVSGPGAVFPGVTGPPLTVGQGRDHSLKGMAVVTTGEPAPGESIHWRDGIIDMWGVGAQYTPFSQTVNLVLQIKGKTDLSPGEREQSERIDEIDGSDYAREYNRAARAAGFRVADFLASVTAGLEPDRTEAFELGPVASSLPKVVYVCQLHRDRWLYGERMGWQPTLLHPNEMMDGAIFSSFMGTAGSRDCSYVYQNHPIVRDLYGRHAKDVNFGGVLLWYYGPMSLTDKERIGSFATKILKMLRVDGAVMTWVGDGQSGVDVMMMCQKIEQAGIKTTLLSPEMARTPEDPGFVHYVDEADAIVSTGNYEMALELPVPEVVFGGRSLTTPKMDATGSMALSVRYLYDAVSPLGFGRLAGRQY